ncbi:hypothetical protein H5J25_03440 [Sphingomonas aliaeris]|uniref:Winged helix DNA-binding domain-containing protein n=1 Tax=Sphingomonas aliaeris TaxID=2759526 RepID=A0A974NVZ7_9SPHN|nr:hypothetical protein [Sphingomonas aliaeris]QQV77828.1 hypothetical protein H5J25_03440 [Sphingomonas aliaeris]
MTGEAARQKAQDDDILSPDQLVLQARRSIAVRRALMAHLPSSLIPDPSLDFLSALYVAHAVGGRGLSRRQLCEQTTVAANVGARWVGALRAENLVVEQADETRLSAQGLRLVEDGLKAVLLASHAIR